MKSIEKFTAYIYTGVSSSIHAYAAQTPSDQMDHPDMVTTINVAYDVCEQAQALSVSEKYIRK